MDPNGTLLSTTNYNKLKRGGYNSYGLLNLSRGYKLQVQSNVSGIDPTRTDVVTVDEVVKLRPDPAITDLAASRTAMLRTPVTISATVHEQNGDVGARANCVLYIDGQEADRANGIWVDAAGTVSCAFAQTFTSTGSKQVRVALENVVPGDWDGANNAASATVVVGDVRDFTWHHAYIEDVPAYRYSYRGTWDNRYTNPATGAVTRYTGEHVYDQAGQWQSLWHYGGSDRETTFPLANLSVKHASNGSTLAAHEFTHVTPYWQSEGTASWGAWREACAFRYVDGAGGSIWVNFCSGAWKSAGEVNWHPWSYFQQHRRAGQVTYVGHYFAQRHYGNTTTTEHSHFWNGSYQSGLPLPQLGATYELLFSVTGANGLTQRSNPTVTLVDVSSNFERPHTCWAQPSGEWFFSGCDRLSYSLTRRVGWVYFAQ